MKKKQERWIVALYAVVILASLAWSGYEIYTEGTVKTTSLIRCVAIIAGAVLGIYKTLTGRRRTVVMNKDAVYRKAYDKQIGSAFTTLPKEQKQFYHALDLYNNQEYRASLSALEKLDEQCRCAAEQKAIAFFMGRNLERMKEFEAAVACYEKSLRISPDAKSANNIASCWMCLGDPNKEYEYLNQALQIDPNYATGYNNMGQFLIRMAEYEKAIPYLHRAHQLDGTLTYALSGLAICYAMLGDRENYEKAYRMAVTLGYNGKDLKEFIRSLEPKMEL